MDLLRKVTESIKRHRWLSNGDAVLVAVSGGPDSVALLHLLCELRNELELRLEVAHLQHGIRGEAAHGDAQFVAESAKKFKLPFHFKEVNIPQLRSRAGKGNLEAMAREERYRFFAEVAQERGLTKIATAHTEDDQAETMLMWFLRGAGRKGLAGMSPIQRLGEARDIGAQDILLIRPLLEVSKAEIIEYLHQKHLSYRLDRTNQDTNFLRNWIRLDLIPQLKERIDPQLPSRLARAAELLRDEEELLDSLARAELDRIRSAKELNRELFLKRGTAMRRRILRLWIEETRGQLRGVDFAHVEELLKLIERAAPQGRLAIPGGWELVKEYETIKLEKRFRRLPRVCYSYQLGIGMELSVPEAGMTLLSERVADPHPKLPDDFMEAVFDMASLPEALTVRNFRNGDRFQPLGMAGHKKLKDLFIEKKVPLSVRETLPLLSVGEEILWIPGYGRSEIAKIGPQTKAALRLKAIVSLD